MANDSHGHSLLRVALNQESSIEDFGRLLMPLRVFGSCSSKADRNAVLEHSSTNRKGRDTELVAGLGQDKALLDIQVDQLSPVDREVPTRSCRRNPACCPYVRGARSRSQGRDDQGPWSEKRPTTRLDQYTVIRT